VDAREYFQLIVQPNYYEFCVDQNNIRLLWNAIVSMNTVPEYLVIDRLEYRLDVLRGEIERETDKIREDFGLTDLQYCANTFKHVRKMPSHKSFEINASSTSVDPIDQATWVLDGHDLVQVAHDAFAKLSKATQELKPTQ
jgi:hypothetical protein